MVGVGRGTRTRILALISSTGILACITAIAFLTVARTDLSPVRRGISEYAFGPFGSLLAAAFAALGVGSLALGIGLAGSGHGSRSARLGGSFVALWGVCVILAGFVPTDVVPPISRAGIAHGILVSTGSVALIGAMLVHAHTLRSDARWQPWCSLSYLLRVAALLGAIGYSLAQRDGVLLLVGGLLQRCFFTPLVAWLLLATLWLGVQESGDCPGQVSCLMVTSVIGRMGRWGKGRHPFPPSAVLAAGNEPGRLPGTACGSAPSWPSAKTASVGDGRTAI